MWTPENTDYSKDVGSTFNLAAWHELFYGFTPDSYQPRLHNVASLIEELVEISGHWLREPRFESQIKKIKAELTAAIQSEKCYLTAIPTYRTRALSLVEGQTPEAVIAGGEILIEERQAYWEAFEEHAVAVVNELPKRTKDALIAIRRLATFAFQQGKEDDDVWEPISKSTNRQHSDIFREMVVLTQQGEQDYICTLSILGDIQRMHSITRRQGYKIVSHDSLPGEYSEQLSSPGERTLHVQTGIRARSIADDVLRDLFVRGKYRDVILPMCVLRRLDAVLEPTKQAVLDTKVMLDMAGITEQRAALCGASGQAFYNTSAFTLRDLRARGNQQKLRADFEAYLDGFSSNVQDILTNFEFRNIIPRLSKADALGTMIAKFLDPEINLSPNPVLNGDGTVKHPPMDNHSMGTVFEELVRKFNEENNEEAGEHWTPRDAVKLMANLVFLPVADKIDSGSYLIYDGALGTGGMLTVAEETLKQLAASRGKKVVTHLYGQEINPETYAICKADMLLKGEGENADHVVGGAEWSTLSHDAFPAREFDFMLSNPPYGKSWKKDLETMGGKDGMRDPRFKVTHNDEELNLVTRSSDGQLLFLANMVSKMNGKTKLGSRIAEVHNGSSLFTGDAGQGESNIRRWIIENDWLEAIVALPLNLFYNTGIATYIWVLSNHKAKHRAGKVQLIDATQWFEPLRKNLGKKNCQLSSEHIERICDAFTNFEETEQSKIFSNDAFGYRKVLVNRPLRLHSQITPKAIESLRFASGDEEIRAELYDHLGEGLFSDFAEVRPQLETALSEWGANDESDEEEGDDAPAKKGLPERKKKKLLDAKTWDRDGRLVEVATALRHELGGDLIDDHNKFRDKVDAALKKLELKLSSPELKVFLRAVSWRVESAPPVIGKVHKAGKAKVNPLYGYYSNPVGDKKLVIEYEPDSDLRDTEQVPLQEDVETFIQREVMPYTPDAWIDASSTKIGYEISFTRHFYKQQPLRTLEEIRADILSLEQETEGMLAEIIGGAAQ